MYVFVGTSSPETTQKPPAPPTTNNECNDGSKDCGTNAYCHIIRHRINSKEIIEAKCECFHGFEGNPKIGCFPGMWMPHISINPSF